MRKMLHAILGMLVCLPLVSCGARGEASTQAGEELVLTLPGAAQVKLTLRRIPAGTFMMGMPKDTPRLLLRTASTPFHQVTLSKSFYMGACEVTQEQWEAVMGTNPSRFGGRPKHPVDFVSWDDVQAFIKKLNTMGLGTFRLPTEAEWEYACRAGTKTLFYWGDDVDYGKIGDYAWYHHNASSATHPVGQKKPNSWGLYDMTGNVSEWCGDWYMGTYPSVSQTDPTGTESGRFRVIRGGSWREYPESCPSAFRDQVPPSVRLNRVGFRLVKTVAGPVAAPTTSTPARAPGEELVLTLPGAGQVKLAMRRIPAGTFGMGSPIDEEGRYHDEGPIHQVVLSKPFYMGVYELTQEQWLAVMGTYPSYYGHHPNFPVENVSWDDVRPFIEKLNTMGLGTFRLPTEAEWEYACRAGTKTRFYWGDDPDKRETDGYAWFSGNSYRITHAVGHKKPNAWGLYDMIGNVQEWCQDLYADKYSSQRQTDPTGPQTGSLRVSRGGSCRSGAEACRSAGRSGGTPSNRNRSVGFRLVRTIP